LLDNAYDRLIWPTLGAVAASESGRSPLDTILRGRTVNLDLVRERVRVDGFVEEFLKRFAEGLEGDATPAKVITDLAPDLRLSDNLVDHWARLGTFFGEKG
jgi:hypothetical protein